GYRALGRYYLEKPSPEPEKAETHLEEAVRIAPGMLCNHLDLAQAYLKQGKTDLARERQLYVLNAPSDPEFAVENKRCKEEARLLHIE
ncbi:MAG: tetratricopeptide repeat protein, partial [Candidatus Methylomirabilales bacterium]